MQQSPPGPTPPEPNSPRHLPAIHDVLLALRRIRPHLPPTPLLHSPALSDLLQADVHLKCENLQPTGAFKVRGGLNLIAVEAEDLRANGTPVVAASTGNHGQSVAYSARRFGIEAAIYAPLDANPLKVAAMQRLGATVRLAGRDFDEAREACEADAAQTGARYIHSMNEPLLIAGVATASLEALTELPDADYLLVPVGGGSGAAGAALVAHSLCPGCRVVGVLAEGAPAVHDAFHSRRLGSTDRADTIAEGLATRVAFDLPLQVMWGRLHDMVLVADRELVSAMALSMETAHLVVEAAGAAPLAAALRVAETLRGRRVVLILSGGNATAAQMQQALATEAAPRPQERMGI